MVANESYLTADAFSVWHFVTFFIPYKNKALVPQSFPKTTKNASFFTYLARFADFRQNKKPLITLRAYSFTMAGVVGFEPTMAESESVALPLGDTPIFCHFNISLFYRFCKRF